MENIIDAIKGHLTSELMDKASGMFGESSSGVAKAAGGLIPTILGGLLQKSNDTSAFGSIFDMLSDDKNAGFLDNLGGLIGGGNLAHGDPKDIAGSLMGKLFGNKVGGILDLVSSVAGIKKSSTSGILGLVGPLIMGYLGKKIKGGGLNAAGLASLLLGQKDNIMSALPAGMGDLLGFAKEAEKEVEAAASSNWMKWLLPLLVLAALWYFMKDGCNTPKVDLPDTEAIEEKVEDMASEAKDAIEDTASSVAGFFKRKLACGIELDIPEDGIEAKVVEFIEDAAKEVDKTTWFNFDRLTFETGSANLNMEASEEQLNNIAEIMKCYPNTKIKLGGYTDNTGDAAANMTLSQNRADNVMAALVAKGIASERLAAEGYGDAHPVASNDTEEGRAQNRRIALRLSAK